MSLNTTSKRRSSVQVLQPGQVAPPAPTGTLDAADRQHIAWSYSGILAYNTIIVTTTLVMTDMASVNGSTYTQSITTTLSISDIALGSILAGAATTILTISDSAIQNYDYTGPSETDISISDTALGRLSITELALNTNIHITDSAYADISLQSCSVSTILEISDEARHILPDQILSTTLSITDSGYGSLGLGSTLSITDSVSYNLSKGLATTLNITDSAVSIADLHLSLITTLVINQSAIGYTEAFINVCHYNPISTTLPSVPSYTKQATITLTYPYVSPTTTIMLRSPSLENTHQNIYNRILRESRGGDQKIFRSTPWPKYIKLNYEIIFNKHQQQVDFINFVVESIGKEVGLLDYLGRQWRGIIIPNDNIVSQSGRFNRVLNFEYDGELIS